MANKLRILIGTCDEQWRWRCIEQIPGKNCEIENADSGARVLHLLRSQLSELIIVDDTLPDLSPLEFALNARDLVQNGPYILIGGAGLAPFEHVWSRCGVFFAGNKEAVPPMIHEAFLELHLRHEHMKGWGDTPRPAQIQKQARIPDNVPVQL